LFARHGVKGRGSSASFHTKVLVCCSFMLEVLSACLRGWCKGEGILSKLPHKGNCVLLVLELRPSQPLCCNSLGGAVGAGVRCSSVPAAGMVYHGRESADLTDRVCWERSGHIPHRVCGCVCLCMCVSTPLWPSFFLRWEGGVDVGMSKLKTVARLDVTH